MSGERDRWVEGRRKGWPSYGMACGQCCHLLSQHARGGCKVCGCQRDEGSADFGVSYKQFQARGASRAYPRAEGEG